MARKDPPIRIPKNSREWAMVGPEVTLRKVQDGASDYDVYYGKKYLGFIYKVDDRVEVEHPKTGMTWDIDEKWNTMGILAGVHFLLMEAGIKL